MSTIILGIESSCDDTSIAIWKDGIICSNVISSQAIHQIYGGVVPEAASRLHIETIVPVYQMALEKANIRAEDISAIAVTRGPGLLGSLIVGLSLAKSLALSLNIPLIEVNHLQAHVLSLFIDEPKPSFPFLCLTVSGGHTQLVIVRDFLEMEVIGQTIDDAAGEAFDKIGKIVGLPYPAGPVLDKLAAQGKPTFNFPRTKLEKYQYSFSGLKTSVLYFIQHQLKNNSQFIEENKNDLCASVQEVIIDNLCYHLIQAAADYKIQEIGIAGGVSANSGLRKKLNELAIKNNWKVYFPKLSYCTDNAAMIATVGYYKFLKSDFAALDITALAKFPMQ